MTHRLLALALLAPVLGGCATKRDLRDLRTEIDSLRMSQEAMSRDLQRQNATILDTLAAQDVRLRGDLGNQLVQIERQLIQIMELTGQGQQALAEFRRSLRTREEAIRAQQEPMAGQPDVGEPNELFATAQDALQRGSYRTAREAFEEFVRAFPQHPRASEAQLRVGEALVGANEPQRAFDAYGRVLELYPNSEHAPTALYRAALIELERKNDARARAMLNQVVAAYPNSPEAALARERLNRRR
jgi:tol-pal system protein YbgF